MDTLSCWKCFYYLFAHCVHQPTHTKFLAFYFHPQDMILMLSVSYTLTYSIFFIFHGAQEIHLHSACPLPEPQTSLFRKLSVLISSVGKTGFQGYFPICILVFWFLTVRELLTLKLAHFKWFITFYPQKRTFAVGTWEEYSALLSETEALKFNSKIIVDKSPSENNFNLQRAVSVSVMFY